MKKYSLIFLLLAAAFLLVSCVDLSTLECSQEHLDGFCCVSTVPGTYTENPEDITCELIETDSYGRRLLRYDAYSEITKSRETTFVMCQKSESYGVYFYEDICYLPIKGDDAEASLTGGDEELSAFKAQNDWGLPLKEEKLSCRVVYSPTKFPLYPVYLDMSIQRALRHLLQTEVQGIYWQDEDAWYEHSMYYVEMADGTRYMAMFSDDEDCYEGLGIALLKIEEKELDREAYAAFKKANGWVYGQ